jgi:glycosyltransferase involved in cell wall biosynthesis
MSHNTNLAITIPTYNRAAILEDHLLHLLPDLILNSIPVYISDDSDNSETEAAMTRLKSQYPYIYYHKNQQRLGHDRNFFAALSLPDSKYVWYLGDGMVIRPGAFEEILKSIDLDLDFYFVNARVQHSPSVFIPASTMTCFLRNHAWHLTMSGATIYGVRPRAMLVNVEKNIWKNFVQLGFIFEFCSQYKATAYWNANLLIGGHIEKGQSYWASQSLSVFVFDWVALISSFPNLFFGKEKIRVIKSHAVYAKLFDLKHLLRLRLAGVFTYDAYCAHRDPFRWALPFNIVSIWVILKLPIWLVRFFCKE